jgi:hypothetical protein
VATPLFDRLSVDLAGRLGDPYTPDGQPVGPIDDGIAYSAAQRDAAILEAARRVLNTMGPRQLAARGMTRSYLGREQITSTPHDIPDDLARIYELEYYGKRMVFLPFPDGRRSSVYWQNTPMFEVDWQTEKIILHVPRSSFEVTLYYLREIPTLVHGGADDLNFDNYMAEHVLDYAESIGRRLHQEFNAVRQAANQEMQKHKEND